MVLFFPPFSEEELLMSVWSSEYQCIDAVMSDVFEVLERVNKWSLIKCILYLGAHKTRPFFYTW